MGKICVSLLLLGMLFDTFDALVIGDEGSCCVKKTVGGVAYTLVTEGDTTKYGCKENCIYTKDDQPDGTQFCFKAGGSESVCNPDMEGCPAGYESMDGDIPGWGQLKGRINTTMEGCSEECSKHEGCCSYEYSFSSRLCNLNKDCAPTQGKYEDYHFCTKNEITVFTHGYAYQYFPYNGERFDFKVEAKSDAVIALDSDENDSDLYEIVIGGWGNSLSMVRRGKQGPNIGTGSVDKGSSPGQKGWTETSGILSASEFRGFWITTEYVNNKLEIRVGKDGESNPFMTGSDPNPLKIQKVAFSTFGDNDATFIF